MRNANVGLKNMVTKGRILAARTLKDIRRNHKQKTHTKLTEKSVSLLTARGQSSGIQVAGEILKVYNQSSEQEKIDYFKFLLTEFGRDKKNLVESCQAYGGRPDHDNLKALILTIEPKRQEFFKRINMAPGGTNALIEMRADLLRFLKTNPELKPVDLDFLLLFKTWFNRGFLTMEPISWTSPALLLERLIAYEAVHEITS